MGFGIKVIYTVVFAEEKETGGQIRNQRLINMRSYSK